MFYNFKVLHQKDTAPQTEELSILNITFLLTPRSNVYRGAWKIAVGTPPSIENCGVYTAECHQEN
jgi:hypothetical protein